MSSVWVVDDDRSIRWVLEKALAREGIAHKSFASVYEVTQALLHAEPQVIVTDIRMPGESGLALLAKLKERHPTVRVIIMTAYSDLDSAVAAFQGGAFEYLPKPFDVDHALALIRRASAETPAASTAAPPSVAPPEMLGQAPAMQEVFRAIGRLSQSHVTVLITGESGTGKSTLVRAIAGLWPWGKGRVEVEAGAKMLLMPQQAYVPVGTLRRAVTYPRPAEDKNLDEVGRALKLVGLDHLVEHVEEEAPWDQILSGGEKQRLAFARILLHRPNIVVLDEATSALDPASQDRLMELLTKELSATTIVSVAHRPELEVFHDRKITLERQDGGARFATDIHLVHSQDFT